MNSETARNISSGEIRVSVVIPVYNGTKTIGACLDSLLCQDFPPDEYEIIVVENGSTDGTFEFVKQCYPSVRLIHSDQRGPSIARNLGINLCRGEVVAFTDADCVADPHWLCSLLESYRDMQVGGVGGRIHGHIHGDMTDVERFLYNHSPLINFISGEGEFLPHLYTANASFRRSVLQQVGGFNPLLITGEDVDLSWRVQLKTHNQLAYNDHAVINHHHRSTLKGMIRQFRQYGFGEILLDTMYKPHPGYPRSEAFQRKRILQQVIQLPAYLASVVIRSIRRVFGAIDRAEQIEPFFLFLIEISNITGKIEGLIATRGMSDPQPVFHMKSEKLIDRYFPMMKD